MKKLSILLLASVALVGTSCLKDEEYDNQTYGLKGLEDVDLVEITAAPRRSVTLNASPNDTTFTAFTVRLNSEAPAAEDIQVTLAVNNDTVPKLGFAVAPANAYTLVNPTVTIPKGEREAAVQLKVKSSALTDKTYGIGVGIQSVSNPGVNISRNYSTIVVATPVKNQYDGSYTATGYLYHPTAARAISATKTVTTAGPNSVTVDLGDLGASGYKALITVDPVTNKLTITAAAGAAGGPYTQFDAGLPTSQPGYTPGWAGSATANNYYDPATKTFYVRYGYMGANGWRVTEEALKRK